MQLIRLPEVLQMVSVGKTTWYSLVKDNKAPAPKKLGPRSVAWNKQEIENWINNLPSNSEAPHLDQIKLLQQAFMDSFITAESGGKSGYCIKAKFESLSQMQDAHNALVRLLNSTTPETAKTE
jgi:prophage regulatory protein